MNRDVTLNSTNAFNANYCDLDPTENGVTGDGDVTSPLHRDIKGMTHRVTPILSLAGRHSVSKLGVATVMHVISNHLCDVTYHGFFRTSRETHSQDRRLWNPLFSDRSQARLGLLL
jgi:hypothetical protein